MKTENGNLTSTVGKSVSCLEAMPFSLSRERHVFLKFQSHKIDSEIYLAIKMLAGFSD